MKNTYLRKLDAETMDNYKEKILNIYLAFFRKVKGYSSWNCEQIQNSTTDGDLEQFFTCMYDLLTARYFNTRHFENENLNEVKIGVEK